MSDDTTRDDELDMEPEVDGEAPEENEVEEPEAGGEEPGGGGPTAGDRRRDGPGAFRRLYRGQTSFDFIANRRRWFGISAVIIVAGILSLGIRGLNLGIDFKGGQSWTVTTQTLTVAQATSAVKSAGVSQPTVVQLTNQLTHVRQIEVQADLNSLSLAKRTAVEQQVNDALAKAAGIPVAEAGSKISFSDVGPTWGGQVTSKAVEALIVFFIAVVLYISIRFEFKMAVAALVAVIHDILVTVGIYSLTGFQVTPDTVIAVLTVLGYSLYDTVVVFDRIGENTKGLGASGRITYSDVVNLSMNQTLARSINTSLVAVIPVLSVLVIGSYVLGATTLENFGLALVIGLTSGAYSSIFIASPLLALMKEREPRYATIRQRLETRGDRLGILTPAAAAAMAGGPRSASRAATASARGTIRPGAAQGAKGAKSAQGGGGSTATAVSDVPPRSGAGPRPTAANRPAPRPRKNTPKSKSKGGKGRKR